MFENNSAPNFTSIDRSSYGELAPVAVYTYTRLDHLKRTIHALRNNFLSSRTVLYVVSDAPKNETHVEQVQAVRNFVDDLDGFKEIVRLYRSENFGAPLSILAAEEQIISDHGKIISMEDDNVTSRNFLSFMNQGLRHFENDARVFSICGYMPPIGSATSGDYWFYPWNLSWGFAMWKHKYSLVYPLINNYLSLKRRGLLTKINRAGGLYITDSLRRDYKKQRSFTDAVLCARMFELGMRSVIPTVSKVMNIGSDGSGMSSSISTKKFDAKLDQTEKEVFDFTMASQDAPMLERNAKQFYNGSMATRLARRVGLYEELFLIRQFFESVRA